MNIEATPEEFNLLEAFRYAQPEIQRVAKAVIHNKGKLSVDAGIDTKGARLKWTFKWTEREATIKEAV